MSVSRTTVRLIATFVASGALVGAAAMPALAAGADHDRDNGRSYSHGYRSDRHHDGHFGDRDWDRGRDWDRDRDRGRDWDRGRGWDGDRGWGRDRDRDRDRGWHHGWYPDRHRDHDRYFGHR
ncbi:hypothetical protein ACF07Y_11695 [Streptomyces sp. NPDC016566]|uniref:hypothetical protein n=1 Tax=Streptomyces sp. NPDC016566 TaxID=3364967 RepID=UPI0036FF39C0